ncbi:metallophosphoesterase [Roseateles sp. YR242]|uniref:metallophosphoesterase family protein n=1 Tax=Roseateles sp. YR242 TaxID=1855305 RepID=UPI0015A5E000|nr:metallophosphoesterase [Roseateles sp. YR242]
MKDRLDDGSRPAQARAGGYAPSSAGGAPAADAGPDPAVAPSGHATAGRPHKAGETPRAARPFRIFHLSDVHFGNHFDESVWNYVGELARRERPDLVVCTGDLVDHGGLFMLAAAQQEFKKFTDHLNDWNRKNGSERNVQFRCVPGNHDCGPWGNLKFRPFSTNFGAIFGAVPIQVPAWMPAYLQYRRSSFLRRCLHRVFQTPALYAIKWGTTLWRFFSGKETGFNVPLLRSDDPQEVVLVYLDSNDAMRLATGNVNAREVTKLKALMLNLRDDTGARPFVPRVALLHHHPLPIPEASIEEGLTSFEPFLVLRNAGLVLKELNRCDVDLILHGHKHYAAFGRLGYSIDHHTEGEIAVLAAGSGGVTHSEPGRNSVNLIDILETGRMSFRSIHFGAGGGAPVHEISRGKKEIHGVEMHKARVHRRAMERQGQWIEKVTHAVGVDPTGVAVVRQDVTQHWFERPGPAQVVPVVCSVSLGRVSHNTIELSELSKSAGHQWVNRPKGPVRLVQAGIDVGRRLTGPAVDYGYQYKCFNTYAITQWETVAASEREALHQDDQQPRRPRERVPELELTSYVVRAPLRALVFKVQLPASEQALKPFMQVMRWSTYPATPLDPYGQFHEHGAPGEWVSDAELTAHESANLIQRGDNLWELNVAYPMVGHRYDVRWRAEPARLAAPTRDSTRSRGRTLALRSALLDVPTVQANVTALREWEQFFRDALKSMTSQTGALDDIEIAMFSYDEARHDLIQALVLSPTKPYLIPRHPLVVPLGEGVIGAALKRSQPVMYVDPLLSGSKHEAAYLYAGEEDTPAGPSTRLAGTRWKYVVAFPLSSDVAGEDLDWGPHTTVGVLTLSSARVDSGLVDLVGQMIAAPPAAGAPAAYGLGDPRAEAGRGPGRSPDADVGAGADDWGASEEPGDAAEDVGDEKRRELAGELLWSYANFLMLCLTEDPVPAGSDDRASLPNTA